MYNRICEYLELSDRVEVLNARFVVSARGARWWCACVGCCRHQRLAASRPLIAPLSPPPRAGAGRPSGPPARPLQQRARRAPGVDRHPPGGGAPPPRARAQTCLQRQKRMRSRVCMSAERGSPPCLAPHHPAVHTYRSRWSSVYWSCWPYLACSRQSDAAAGHVQAVTPPPLYVFQTQLNTIRLSPVSSVQPCLRMCVQARTPARCHSLCVRARRRGAHTPAAVPLTSHSPCIRRMLPNVCKRVWVLVFRV